MKRFRYGLNCQNMNSGLIADLVPFGFFEVVPGDSISGVTNAHVVSDVTTRLVLNRAYCDLYAFYVPYRLLWSGFPDFISQGTGTVPTVTDKFEGVYEKEFLIGSVTATSLVPWHRRAYNLIWNNFFRRADDTEVSEDATGFLKCDYRPTTFFESVTEGGAAGQTIDTSGSTVTVDAVREAFAQDQFNKVRNYYGDRYTDYLATIGVKANWSITDDPELIGQSKNSWKYNVTNATAQTTGGPEVAEPAGYWQGQFKLNLRRTFTPEHGLVVMVATTNIEQMSRLASPPLGSFDAVEDYWSPERDAVKERQYTEAIWEGAASVDDSVDMPNFEHLRKGMNIGVSGDSSNFQNYAFTPNLTTVGSYKTVSPTALDTLFQNYIGKIPAGATDAQMCLAADHRLVKRSPVGTRTNAPIR